MDVKERKLTLARLIAIGVTGYASWLTVVLLSGSNFNPLSLDWNFERIGQFGDAFGMLGAVMATLAAVFTFETLDRERQESARLRLREEARDRAEHLREQENTDRIRKQNDAARTAEAEATFFRLLDMRNSIINDLRVFSYSRNGDIIGRSAFNLLIISLAPNKATLQNDLLEAGYEYRQNFDNNVDSLAHYFRFTYHAVRFCHERFGDSAYTYIRILRAQLSETEQILIALNCAFGPGRGPFKSYVEKYALLHNISTSARNDYRLNDLFPPSAFKWDENAVLRIDGFDYWNDGDQQLA